MERSDKDCRLRNIGAPGWRAYLNKRKQFKNTLGQHELKDSPSTFLYISKGVHCIVELSVVQLWMQKLVGNACGKPKETEKETARLVDDLG